MRAKAKATKKKYFSLGVIGAALVSPSITITHTTHSHSSPALPSTKTPTTALYPDTLGGGGAARARELSAAGSSGTAEEAGGRLRPCGGRRWAWARAAKKLRREVDVRCEGYGGWWLAGVSWWRRETGAQRGAAGGPGPKAERERRGGRRGAGGWHVAGVNSLLV